MVTTGPFSEGAGSLRSAKGWAVKTTGHGVSPSPLCASSPSLAEQSGACHLVSLSLTDRSNVSKHMCYCHRRPWFSDVEQPEECFMGKGGLGSSPHVDQPHWGPAEPHMDAAVNQKEHKP